jgi:DNA repair photolyase
MLKTEYREEPCKSAVNRVKGMGFHWSLNPYMGCAHQCTFCYVRAFERRAERPSDDRYGSSIRVKINVAEQLQRELTRKSWKGELVAVGAATDPYQPAEGRYRLTRACLSVMAELGNPFSIVTRGPMIVRDIEVLALGASKADVSVNFSVPTLDRHIWRYTEPHTSPPIQRLRALRRLVDAGIRAGVGVAPILPGLSDKPELLADVVKAARDHGATHVWANVLYLRPGTREHFLDKLASIWPELLPMYEQLYASRSYLSDKETRPLRGTVQKLAKQFEVADRRRIRLAVPNSAELLGASAAASPAEQLQMVLSDDARALATRAVDQGPAARAA